MDVESIPPFVTFEDFIKERIAKFDVVLAIIGPDWLRLLKEKATNGDKDHVKMELEEALRLGIIIAPILIKGANMPPPLALPDSLKPIGNINAERIDDGKNFQSDIQRLFEGLERRLGKEVSVRGTPRTLATTHAWRSATDEELARDRVYEQVFPRLDEGDYKMAVAIINMHRSEAQKLYNDMVKEYKRTTRFPPTIQYIEQRQHWVRTADRSLCATIFYQAQVYEAASQYAKAIGFYREFLNMYIPDDASEDRKFAVERIRILDEVLKNQKA